MEKDLDMKLYNQYLQGEKEAFELLYNKYKDKIQYFVFNIVKDYQKAEDITQEVFIYMLQDKFKKVCSFKTYLYTIAKSRAISFVNSEKNKKEKDELYLEREISIAELDIAEIITKNEKRKEITEAINELEDKYKNAIYLVKYVRVNGMIAYNELYEKEIKNSGGLYIYDVTQNVNFSLNEAGCNLSSKATIVTEYLGVGEDTRFCNFNDTFVIFMKEKNAESPYFALKVDNSDVLEKIEETDEPRLLDWTQLNEKHQYDEYLKGGEYKFYEDENYEYYH